MDVARLKQAGQELVLTAAVAFGISFFGWVTGLSELPNLDALQAAFAAGVSAAFVAFGKAALWFLTGTKIIPDGAAGPELGGKTAVVVSDGAARRFRRDDRGIAWPEALVVIFVILVIFLLVRDLI